VRRAALRRAALLAAVLALLALLGAACSSDGDRSAAIPADVDAIRAAAADAMGRVETARFTIERGGAEVPIDDEGVLVFDRAEGRYAAPASADAVVAARAGGVATEVGAIAIDGEIWITNPVTGRWESAPEGLGFDPTVMFDPRRGWRPLLASGLDDAALVEQEPDADGRYHLRGVAGAARIAVLTSGLVDQAVPIDIWIDGDSGEVREASFATTGPDGTSTWRVTLSGYGDPVEVTPPETGATP
jgi:lipoprotein LprG